MAVKNRLKKVRLADVSVERKLTSRQLQMLTKLYDADPKRNLDAN